MPRPGTSIRRPQRGSTSTERTTQTVAGGRLRWRCLAVAMMVLSLAMPMLSQAETSSGSLEPFPPAPDGQARFVIRLEPMTDESLHHVDLLVGKVIPVDCNEHHFLGELRQETVHGWGYSYYVAKDLHGPAGTLMACRNPEREPRFVSLGGGPHWVRYNSKLPLVVYVPDGFEVRYRIWSAPDEADSAVRE